MTSPVHVIVVTGPPGSGKTTVAKELRELLVERDRPGAMIDMDALRNAWPNPAADPFGEELGRANLAAIWPVLLDRGARWVVLADVVEDEDYRSAYLAAMPGATIDIVRLNTPQQLIRDRLSAREPDRVIDWYLSRTAELQAIMTERDVGDVVIDVGDRPADVVAKMILDAVAD